METLKKNLLDEFTQNYFEKLFYFCLKKTGDSYEAEELVSDITLNIVTAIQKGTIPVHFSAWVWQIARNRYSVWAERRRKIRESDSGADVSEFELAECFIKFSEANGSKWHEGYQSVEDIKWALLMHIASEIKGNIPTVSENTEHKIGKHGWTLRPNGGEWDVLGYEEYTGEEYNSVGLHTCLDLPEEYADVKWGMYKFNYNRIAWKTLNRLNFAELEVLIKLVKQGPAWTKDVEEHTEKILDRLEKNGFVKKVEGGFCPAFWVSRKESKKPFTEEQQAKMIRLYQQLEELANRHFRFCYEMVQAEVPEFLKEDSYTIHFASSSAAVIALKGAILEEALEKGYISYAEDDDRKMLGVYLEL